MAELSEIAAVKIDGEEVSLEEVMRTLKVSGNTGFVSEAVADLLVQRAASAEGITVDDDELQQAADASRKNLGLFSVDQTHQWLKDCGLSEEEFEKSLELGILKSKLSAKVATDGMIEQHFQENRRAYDAARLAHIVVKDEGVAEEICTQLAEDGADFAQLARDHSLDDASKASGGELGIVNRAALSPAVESAVFAAKTGDVVGPIKTDQGYHIIQVREVLLGKLADDEVAATVRQELYAEWLGDQAEKGGVEIVYSRRVRT